ncbi:helix-turn-helix transcriptional regulator [Nonomuraea rubra]|uniref:DNA-binding CsgD family transcriptional regulator n=1 Tax=Nonomuraea rubra TaxID=46180 RepID=A0A7X0TZQ8_9ACTN|nr:LuxR family transcriptional regulator [Nonomuraea rubra]MBB6549826.1 DNA-binding CsgD family transcriptional regulator [Nonomuraea rubra]
MALIERQEELSCLETLIAGAALGEGRIALVSGPPAMGKSALLDALAERAIDVGALAITATASRMEQGLQLGVLRQLIQDAPLVRGERERAARLIEEGRRSATERAGSELLLEEQVVHALITVLLEQSERYPLVILVDDVHHADRASLICLAYMARRVRGAKAVAVFARNDGFPHDDMFGTDVLRLPHCRRLRLPPLSRRGVAALMAGRVGLGAVDRFIDDWYALSGGNPLLAGALAEDYRRFLRTADTPPAELVVGEQFDQAVRECLRRGHPRTAQVAQGLAILGAREGLEELLGLPGFDVSRELDAMAAIGLLDSGTFRHEAVRSAVLAGTELARRRELYRGAAELAYTRGLPPCVVADLLLHATTINASWVVPTLEEAAMIALREGRVEEAISYLKLAWRECADESRRAKIMTMLVRAQWRLNPAAPAGHLDLLTEALTKGSLRGSDAIVLARALLWHGRFDDAREVLERLTAEMDAADHETRAELLVTQLWLRATHPPLVAHTRYPRKADVLAGMVSGAVSRRMESTLALAEVVTRGPREASLRTVERILENTHLDEMSMDVVENSLLALTYAGRCGRAAPLCDQFSAEASARQAPSRQARLAAIRAEISIRQGDLPAAERHARTALETIPMSSWGVAIGGPLASMINALTAMGRQDAVREYLDRPVPKAMFETRYGLHYLHARGRYNLAAESFTLAIHDFLRCGDLMTAWGLDNPSMIPWRADAGEACLRVGQAEEAMHLIEGHLAACDHAAHRARGIGLRLRAAGAEPQRRPALLRQATEYLQLAGDKYELARALSDLAEAYDALGDGRRSRTIAGRALAAAEECHATPMISALSRATESDDVPAPLSGAVIGTLSGAERRVAALAAAGYANHEIADKLYITVSTVEQHLTRTYRKLNITGRADLPLIQEFGNQPRT